MPNDSGLDGGAPSSSGPDGTALQLEAVAVPDPPPRITATMPREQPRMSLHLPAIGVGWRPDRLRSAPRLVPQPSLRVVASSDRVNP